MRKAPVVMVAALLAFGVAADVRAQQGSQHGSMMGPGMMMGMDPDDWGAMPMMMMHMREMMMGPGSMPMMGMGQHIEGRLAFLKTELRITPAQEPLWNALAETMRANAQKMAGAMAACCGGTQDGGTMMAQDAMPSLLERLDWQEKALASQLDALRAMKGALMPLYAAFSDEQKQIAGQLIHGPMGMGMMM